MCEKFEYFDKYRKFSQLNRQTKSSAHTMLHKIDIKNFKSIVHESIEFGRINVFIGENGAGKTNVLEAIAMATAAEAKRLSIEEITMRGIRVARPGMMCSSFKKSDKNVRFDLTFSKDGQVFFHKIMISHRQSSEVFGKWDAKIRRYLVGADKKFEPMIEVEIPSTLADDLVNLITTNKVPGEANLAKLRRAVEVIRESQKRSERLSDLFNSFGIYAAETHVLRGLDTLSRREPLGLYGENLDVFLNEIRKKENDSYLDLIEKAHCISWLDDALFDEDDALKMSGHKLGRSKSKLYFKDRFINEDDCIFSAENANEGVLHILFYLSLFSSQMAPQMFAIDNIETALNPGLCSSLMENIALLTKNNDKQVFITTHSPAILDGLNLHDDDERLFRIYRDDDGLTKIKRVKLKIDAEIGGNRLKLSELWMRGYLGAISEGF